MLSIGLMSGTSMDGIDAALLETDGSPNLLKGLGHTFIPYEPSFKCLLKAAEYAVRKQAGDLDKARLTYPQALRTYLKEELNLEAEAISQLANYLHETPTLDAVIQHSSKLHVAAVRQLLAETGYEAQAISVIGYHGQTLFHRPATKTSVIVGLGQYLAAELGITVVNEFRSQDIAAGGQGAPLAPLYHHALALRDNQIPLVVVNCGGIANLTLIKNAHEMDLLAFDTGPGNGLIDRLIKQRTQGQEHMDRDGQHGKKGQVDERVLKALFEKSLIQEGQNYLLMPAPKSLDIGDLELIAELDALSLADACATLEAFTAASIVSSLDLLNTDIPNCWVLAGGGWHNPVIRQELEQRLKQKLNRPVQLFLADEIGWNSQAMEAQVFAYLAVRSLQGQVISLPGTTKVPVALSGGRVWRVPPPSLRA